MQAVLLLFEALSGLKVNFSKSQLVGVNVSASWLAEAAMVLNCKVGSIPFVYLGLPIGGNARRLAFWEPLLYRIKSRLSSWNSKHLSFSGRLVKEVSGLGVRRIREFNSALLRKWCWRMLVERESMWFRVLSARYALSEGRLWCGGRNSSLWWRDVEVLSREEWFMDNVHCGVGNGENTWFWSDVWVGEVLVNNFPFLFSTQI
ncbi:hypothetical protein MtrunA17_Chr6g0488181 [Medicago truncatula]|uniref:Uncharacterized protein n=1 Tax=Medicago truncatula TaxID=3880 RepID=A0A396HP61_MEDTR|nr:hypothetical protein MtrunA17_Chr6g0488181 [Medicago truncatula]